MSGTYYRLITELRASPLCVLKHVRTRLIILTSGKNNQKIKIAETGQVAVGIRPLDCKYTFYHFRNTEHIDYL